VNIKDVQQADRDQQDEREEWGHRYANGEGSVRWKGRGKVGIGKILALRSSKQIFWIRHCDREADILCQNFPFNRLEEVCL